MELLIDYIAGFTIFAVALAVSTTLIISTSLPPPRIVENYQAQPLVEVREGVVASEKLVRIWIVYYDENGWNVLEETTPANLPDADFVAVLTGVKVVYYEGRAKGNGYVSRHGFSRDEPEPPYILLRGGRVKEVKDK